MIIYILTVTVLGLLWRPFACPSMLWWLNPCGIVRTWQLYEKVEITECVIWELYNPLPSILLHNWKCQAKMTMSLRHPSLIPKKLLWLLHYIPSQNHKTESITTSTCSIHFNIKEKTYCLPTQSFQGGPTQLAIRIKLPSSSGWDKLWFLIHQCLWRMALILSVKTTVAADIC